jgi:hypothetical protein
MNWLPTPPTDNLYKFLAIFGTWGLLFVFGSLLVLSYQNHEHDEFSKKLKAVYSEESWIRKAEARVKSLKENRLAESSIPEISNRFSPKEELLFLSNAIALSKERLAQLKEFTKQPPENIFPFLASIRFDWWLLGILNGTFVCFYFGFRQWLVLQRASDELLQLDLTLKKAQVKELNRGRLRRDS